MSREIKFRAWDYQQKKMLFNIAVYPNTSKVIPIMQYTGLKDKNGKEIYEGDIIIIEDVYKDILLDDSTGPSEPCNHLAPVSFRKSEYGVEIKDGADIFCSGFWSFQSIRYETGQDDYEVIGNIYENPELMGVKDE